MSRKTKRGNPTLPPVHDRKAKDLLRNAQVAPIDVEDPFEPGSKIEVLRSTRRDPLAWMHAHGQVDDVQYQAGRAWQRDWETVEQGARAIDPSKEAVDGGRFHEPFTEGRRKASKRLMEAESMLRNRDDVRILIAFLVDGMGVEQIWLAYFGRHGAGYARRASVRVRGILNAVAECYGLAMPNPKGVRVDRACTQVLCG